MKNTEIDNRKLSVQRERDRVFLKVGHTLVPRANVGFGLFFLHSSCLALLNYLKGLH